MSSLEEGVGLARSGRFEEAKSVFESSLLEDPRNPEVLYNLGMCFTEMGQPGKAVVVLKKSLETDAVLYMLSALSLLVQEGS